MCRETHTQATNHWMLLEWSKLESFYLHCSQGIMEEGFFSAKLKWVIQICLCVEGEFVIVLRSWFRDTEMLRKATSNQALTKVKCTHIYTFTLAHTNTHAQHRLRAWNGDQGLVQSSIKLLKVLQELKHPPIVMLGHSMARQRPCTNPLGMEIIIDRILMHYLRARLLLVKIII